MHIDSLLAETDRLARVGRLRAAANLLEEHLVAEPNCIPALQMLARIWRLQHRPADAIPLLKRVLALQASKRMAGVAAKVAGATVPAPSMSDADSEVLDAKDWDLLRSNDLDIRARRRRFADDIAPIIEAGHESRDGGTPADQPRAASVNRQNTWTETPAASDEEVCAAELHGSSGEGHVADARTARKDRDDPDTWKQDDFFRLPAWNEPDEQEDEAQLRFEALREEEKQAIQVDAQEPPVFDDAVSEVDDLSEGVRFDTEAEAPTFDWTDFAFDADEFDDTPTREELAREVRTTGRISRRERARQQAIEVGREFGWDERGIELITDVFTAYFWSAAKRSMQRELASGLTPDELEIAIGVREFWRERTEFSIDLRRTPSWTASGASRAVYNVLSWPAAIRLVRLTNALPDAIEIERLLDDLYRDWYASERLRDRCPSFLYYLYRWLDYVSDRPDLVSTWSPVLGAAFESDLGGDDENFEPGCTTSRYRMLDRFNLLPHGVHDPLGDHISKAEKKTLAKALVDRSR